MQTYDGNIIKQLAEERGISFYALSKGSGVTQATLSRILNGKVQKPKDSTILAIADFLGVPPERLGLEFSHLSQVGKRLVQRGPSVPVYEPEQVVLLNNGERPATNRFVTYPVSADVGVIDEIVGMVVRGSAMAPYFLDGDIVFFPIGVDLIRAKESSYVTCIISENETETAAVRKIKNSEGDAYWGEIVNPDWPGKKTTLNPELVGEIMCVVREL